MASYKAIILFTDGETLEVKRVRSLHCMNGEYVLMAGDNPRGGQLPAKIWNIPALQVRSISQTLED